MSDTPPKGPRKPGPRKPNDGPRGKKPFGKGARPAGRPGDDRAAGARTGSGKPFSKGPRRSEDKDFGLRPERAGDRPARPAGKGFGKPGGQSRSAGGESAGGDRSFSKGPRRAGGKDFGPRTERRGDRPTRPAGKGFSGSAEQSRPASSETAGEAERIAKRLARAGVASRRDAEEMIAAGRVKVNGKVLETPAINVTFSDRIEIDDKPIPAIERTRLFLYNKKQGTVTTSRDPQGRPTVFDELPNGLPRLISVGRLDINTEGLLLLTNDGGLARQLELPATGWLRRYRVRVHGKVDETALAGLKEGIAVEGVYYGAIEASLDRVQGSNAWLTIGLREGKNREVKNVLGALGLDVTRLIRVSYGPFQLGDLAEGELKEIKGATLREQLGEKLVEEAGANFDAPILHPFSGKSQTAGAPARAEAPAASAPVNRKREREEGREKALGKLTTRPPRPGKRERAEERGARPAGDKPMRGAKGDDKPMRGAKGDDRASRTRGTHVWMAPGARPLGEKKKAEEAKRTEGRRYAGKPRPNPRKPGGRDK
ncbi:MAG: pseudouridine synthase [Aliihoeflea sp.]